MESFDLGSLVATVTFLLVFTQVLPSISRFRLKVAYISLWLVTRFFLIGILLTFLSSIASHLTVNKYINEISFWIALLSALIIVILGLFLIYITFNHSKFTRRNSKKFYASCNDIICKNNENDILSLIEEIRLALPSIFKIINKNQNTPCRKEMCYAGYIFIRLSNKNVVRLIVLYNPLFLCELINNILQLEFFEKSYIWMATNDLISEGVKQLVFQETSILHTENQFNFKLIDDEKLGAQIKEEIF